MTEAAKTARFPGQAAIDAYGNGGFRFAGMSHKGSIICLPDAVEAWDVTRIEDVTPTSLATILERRGQIDLLLLGSGEMHVAPSDDVRAALTGAGIGIDIMATGAAARTWNVLIAEGRPVAAALIATA